jgi:hypothetical protein
MADLTVETAATCAQNIFWVRMVPSASDPKVQYRVEWGPTDWGARHAYGWSCTCPAFHRSKTKTCKHIDAVKGERCRWNSHFEPGYGLGPSDRCPDCHGPLHFLRVGV